MTATPVSFVDQAIGVEAIVRSHTPTSDTVEASAGETDDAISEEFDPVQCVTDRIRALVLTDTIDVRGVDAALSSVLRDKDFANNWCLAQFIVTHRVPFETLMHPVVPPSLRGILGGYREEIQKVASAAGNVVKAVSDAKTIRLEVAEISAQRLILPAYLDDESLPLEVWEVLRSKDLAAVAYIALVEGFNMGVTSPLLGEYAQRHIRHQQRYLDFLAWMFDVPCDPFVGERKDWEQIFCRNKRANEAADRLFATANQRGGFVVGEIPDDDGDSSEGR